ncbi:hypothetical protein [Rhodococcus pyridinivorans]|nr:hypothetical protein [Rhodococcus pyridinivorans]
MTTSYPHLPLCAGLALYLTGPQLAGAHGNRRTRVPTGVLVPRSWSSE